MAEHWARAGLNLASSEVYGLSLRERLTSHLRREGLIGYLSAGLRALADPRIRRVFLNPGLLGATRRFLPMVGYGLYAGRKIGR